MPWRSRKADLGSAKRTFARGNNGSNCRLVGVTSPHDKFAPPSTGGRQSEATLLS
jgi:hypothetical protein